MAWKIKRAKVYHKTAALPTSDWKKLYNIRRWKRLRLQYLDTHPMCCMCGAAGVYRMATVVDHIAPHKGCDKLFWDQNNWQPLCERCHNIKTVAQDGGFGRKTSP